MLWDFLLFRGEIVFFHLLIAVFTILKENSEQIESDRIFESIKKIILKGECKILEEVENAPTLDFDVLAILDIEGIRFN